MFDDRIKSVHARHLVDCKCRGLLEVDIITESGAMGRAAAPTGTSVGAGEAFVMRDEPGRFLGTSVYKAVEIVREVIAPALIGLDVADQKKIDKTLLKLDGTPRKTKLGGNSIYSVSVACMLAAANAHHLPLHRYLNREQAGLKRLPLPIINMFNGGTYGDISVQIQEFGVIPYGAADMQEAVEMGIVMFAEVGKIIAERQHGRAAEIANYFGHKPISSDPEILYDIIAEAAARLDYTDKLAFAADFAAGEFYNKQRNTYTYNGREMDRDELIGQVQSLTSRHRFYSVEDVLEDDDFEGFALAAQRLPGVRIIGDDLICTSVERLDKALSMKCCDGMVFKPNQVGTVSQCLEAYDYAVRNKVMVIPSVRAGGTIDDPVKDMAIALNVPLCKCGAPRSGERISFLNTLLRAADEFPQATFHPIFDLERVIK